MKNNSNRNMGGDPPCLWTVKNVADYLQVSVSWVYQNANAGTLPVRRIGANLRFIPDEIHAYALGEWRPATNVTPLRR